tara:strand:- start:385 stop:825 length:441 start_codon:yes stop_codon:yes gene_type:complete
MEQLIEDWDYLLNDDSEIAHQIKELVNDASDHYIHDFWTETPTETLASVDGDFLLELKPLLVQYSGEPMDNAKFFSAINEDAGYEYVTNPDEQKVVRTRDSIQSFLDNHEFHDVAETSHGKIWKFFVGSHELLIQSEGEFRYCWTD